MFINTLKQLAMILIALSMFVISMVTWRYQGDIHHMSPKVFESNQSYPEDLYHSLWTMHSQGSPTTMAMRAIPLTELPAKLYHHTVSHPSESIITGIIDDPSWEKFIPNSQSSTYKTFQTFWISRHMGIKEVMNYRLKGIEEASLRYFDTPLTELNRSEVETLLHRYLQSQDASVSPH